MKMIITERYTAKARGQLVSANPHSPVAIAQKERVKPHRGHGRPVR